MDHRPPQLKDGKINIDERMDALPLYILKTDC